MDMFSFKPDNPDPTYMVPFSTFKLQCRKGNPLSISMPYIYIDIYNVFKLTET